MRLKNEFIFLFSFLLTNAVNYFHILTFNVSIILWNLSFRSFKDLEIWSREIHDLEIIIFSKVRAYMYVLYIDDARMARNSRCYFAHVPFVFLFSGYTRGITSAPVDNDDDDNNDNDNATTTTTTMEDDNDGINDDKKARVAHPRVFLVLYLYVHTFFSLCLPC